MFVAFDSCGNASEDIVGVIRALMTIAQDLKRGGDTSGSDMMFRDAAEFALDNERELARLGLAKEINEELYRHVAVA